MERAQRADRFQLRIGLGLRPELWRWTLEHAGELDAVELIADDVLHLTPAQAARQLAEVREAGLGIAVHGVDLSLASVDGPDSAYVERIARLLDALGVETYSEHCAYHRLGGRAVGQFMPVPFTAAWAERVAGRVEAVQRAIGRPMLVENIAYLTEHPRQGLGEAGFFRAVCELSGCGLLLDLENVAVNAANHGYDALELLAGLPLERASQLHLAGGHRTAEGIAVDSHSAPVRADVLELLAAVVPRLPTGCLAVVERDKAFPETWESLAEEFAAIRAAAERVEGAGGALGGREPLKGGEDYGADAVQPEAYQRAWIDHFQMPARPERPEEPYVATVEPRFRESFAAVLRSKRRDKLEPLLPGTWRCLGELGLRDGLLREWFAAEPRQDLSRNEEVAGFAARVAACEEAPEALRAVAEHEATLVELGAEPFRPWPHKLFPKRRERGSRFAAKDLDAVGSGRATARAEERAGRLRYTRRAQGVWVEDL